MLECLISICHDLIFRISVIVLIRINIYLFFQCIEIFFWVSFNLWSLRFLINLIALLYLSKVATLNERAFSQVFSFDQVPFFVIYHLWWWFCCFIWISRIWFLKTIILLNNLINLRLNFLRGTKYIQFLRKLSQI